MRTLASLFAAVALVGAFPAMSSTSTLSADAVASCDPSCPPCCDDCADCEVSCSE